MIGRMRRRSCCSLSLKKPPCPVPLHPSQLAARRRPTPHQAVQPMRIRLSIQGPAHLLAGLHGYKSTESLAWSHYVMELEP